MEESLDNIRPSALEVGSGDEMGAASAEGKTASRRLRAGLDRALWAARWLGRELGARGPWMLRASALVAALSLSFWAGMGPRWDYPYSSHIDEWKHRGDTLSLIEGGSLVYTNPNPHPHRIGDVRYHRELGFHVLYGFLETTTGLIPSDLHRIAPAVQMALLALLVYALGVRSGYGWSAALLVPLLPTSTRTLGPEFAVPVAIALLFVPVTLMVVHRLEERGRGESLWLLMVLIGGTLFIHPTTEAVVTGFTAMALGLALIQSFLARQYRGAASLLAAIAVRMAVPVLVLQVWLPGTAVGIAREALLGEVTGIAAALGFNQGFFGAFGVIGVGLFVVGIVLFTMQARHGLMSYLLPTTTVSLALYLVVFYPRYSYGPPSIYERGWVFLGLFMVILAGYAVGAYFRAVPDMARAAMRRLTVRREALVRAPLFAAGVVVLAAALYLGLTSEERWRYTLQYRMVTEAMVADMAWIGDHRPADANRVFLEPSLGWTFPSLAGLGNIPWRSSAPPDTDWVIQKAWEMLGSGELDMDFIPRQDIYLIYTCLPGSGRCNELKAGLPEVREGVYWLPEWRRWRELP